MNPRTEDLIEKERVRRRFLLFRRSYEESMALMAAELKRTQDQLNELDAEMKKIKAALATRQDDGK